VPTLYVHTLEGAAAERGGSVSGPIARLHVNHCALLTGLYCMLSPAQVVLAIRHEGVVRWDGGTPVAVHNGHTGQFLRHRRHENASESHKLPRV